MSISTAARLSLPMLLLAALGCDHPTCPAEESFLVEEVGTCAPAPTRFLLESHSCRISVQSSSTAPTGLPAGGAMSQSPRPVREGDFILYGDDPTTGFRLCRAQRVAFRLELTCVDGQGAPVCAATLTEPGP